MIRNILANDNAEDYYSESRSDCDFEEEQDDALEGRVSFHYDQDDGGEDEEEESDDDSELDLDYNFKSTPLRNSSKQLIKRK